jgi:hypothetical protein
MALQVLVNTRFCMHAPPANATSTLVRAESYGCSASQTRQCLPIN